MLRLLLCCALLLAPAASAQSDATVRTVEGYLSTLDSAQQLSGTVLVARGRDILLEKSFGRRDYRSAGAITPATPFAVASITKPLTGIAARLLAERGVLGLDDPVARWLPEFPNGSRITITHLLSHRSGIPHRVTTLADEQQQQNAESMTGLISRASLLFEPGAQRLYSSAGYSLLARVLERATGRSYSALLRELVLQPAGAMDALDATEPPDTRARAKGHFWTPEGPLATTEKQLSFLVGAGSLWTTPRDLFKVVRRVAEGAFGSAASAGARMPNGSIQWTGFSNGLQTIVGYDPATDITIVVTSNLLTGAAEWIARDVPRIVAGLTVGRPAPPRPAIAAVAEAQRRQIEGMYDFGGSQQQLSFVRPSLAILGGEYALVATSDSTFFAPQNYAELRVIRAADGAVASLEFAGQGGLAMRRVR